MTIGNIEVVHGVAGVPGPVGPPGAGYDSTSSSGTTVGLGSKLFVTQAEKAYQEGTRLRIASEANPTINWMEGVVSDYTGVNLNIIIDLISDSSDDNPHADWTIGLAGQPGAPGARGINGAPGIPGNRFFYGPDAPTGSVPADAIDGDSYIRQVSSTQQDLYAPKAAGAWPAPINLVGPAGTNSYKGTSATTLTVGTGSKSFVTQAGLAYSAGARARAASAADPTSYMEGVVTSYSASTLVINVDKIGTAGTHADWNINIAGDAGSAGSAGAPGPAGTTGPGYAATSTTSNAVGLGSKGFVTQAGLAYSVGARVRVASTSSPANYVEGPVTAYSGTNLTVNADAIGGSGTFTSWTINIAGQPGPQGPTGPAGAGSGDMLRSNNLSDVLDVNAARANIGAGQGDMLKANNLSDVVNPATARANIGAGQGDMLGANNLSEITNPATARAAIGAGTGNGDMLKADNLSGIASPATARTNIGAGDMSKSENLTGLADYPTARSNLGLGALATKANVAYADINTAAIATAAEFWANAASKVISVNGAWSAAALQNVASASGTLNLNFANGLNWLISMVGNVTMSLPTNLVLGRSGLIAFQQDATANRTISWGSNWYPLGQVLPVTETRASKYTFVSYFILTATIIVISGGPIEA